MAFGGWRIVVSALLIILLVEESAAKRISSSRRGHRKNALSLGLGLFRAQQANEVDDDIGEGDTTTITSNSQTSATTRRSSSTSATTSRSVATTATLSTEKTGSTGSSIPTITSTTTTDATTVRINQSVGTTAPEPSKTVPVPDMIKYILQSIENENEAAGIRAGESTAATNVTSAVVKDTTATTSTTSTETEHSTSKSTSKTGSSDDVTRTERSTTSGSTPRSSASPAAAQPSSTTLSKLLMTPRASTSSVTTGSESTTSVVPATEETTNGSSTTITPTTTPSTSGTTEEALFPAEEIQYRVRHFEAGEEEISESAGASETAFPPNSADGSDKCPGFVGIDNGCYAIISTRVNWLVANDVCKSLHKDAHLVFISSAQKRAAIKALVAYLDEDACPAAWTGGQRSNRVRGSSSPFVWKRDTSVWTVPSSAEELDNESEGGCLLVQLRYEVAWKVDAADCSTEACVICELQPRHELPKET